MTDLQYDIKHYSFELNPEMLNLLGQEFEVDKLAARFAEADKLSVPDYKRISCIRITVHCRNIPVPAGQISAVKKTFTLIAGICAGHPCQQKGDGDQVDFFHLYIN